MEPLPSPFPNTHTHTHTPHHHHQISKNACRCAKSNKYALAAAARSLAYLLMIMITRLNCQKVKPMRYKMHAYKSIQHCCTQIKTACCKGTVSAPNSAKGAPRRNPRTTAHPASLCPPEHTHTHAHRHTHMYMPLGQTKGCCASSSGGSSQCQVCARPARAAASTAAAASLPGRLGPSHPGGQYLLLRHFRTAAAANRAAGAHPLQAHHAAARGA